MSTSDDGAAVGPEDPFAGVGVQTLPIRRDQGRGIRPELGDELLQLTVLRGDIPGELRERTPEHIHGTFDGFAAAVAERAVAQHFDPGRQRDDWATFEGEQRGE